MHLFVENRRIMILPLCRLCLILFSVLCLWLQKYKKIDVVVSNAAANPSVDAILETKELALDKLWEINVKTSILLLQVNKDIC